MSEATIYRYGALAWFWRLLIAAMLLAGTAILIGSRLVEPVLLVGAAALLAPALFFGMALAVRVDRIDSAQADVRNLLFWKRRIRRERLGPARIRQTYEGRSGPMYAPRVWIRCAGACRSTWTCSPTSPIVGPSPNSLACPKVRFPTGSARNALDNGCGNGTSAIDWLRSARAARKRSSAPRR